MEDLAKRMNKLAKGFNKHNPKLKLVLNKIKIAAIIGKFTCTVTTHEMTSEEVLIIADDLYKMGFNTMYTVQDNKMEINW